MAENKPRRIFWFEGVTRGEIERSLNDTRPSALRRQGPRRALVATTAVVIAALALAIFIPQVKVKTYTELPLLAMCLVLYLNLRKSVRHLSDAPNELLDERQIALRDAGYTVAYRLLASLSLLYVGLIALITPDGALAIHVHSSSWWNILMSYLMLCGTLPSMVLAWRMQSEQME
jgi:hypothetical protein